MRRWFVFFVILVGAVWVGVVAAQRQLSGLPLAPDPRSVFAGLRQAVSLKQQGELTDTTAGLTDLPILMYHHIQTLPASQSGTIDWGLSISVEDFSKQLAWLQQQGYESVSMADALSGDLPGKPIILTFDDGYADFSTNAWPLLRQYGYTATLYVITNRIGSAGFLTKNDLLTLANGGIEIGSHTVSHPNLSKMTGTKLAAELVNSRTELKRLTGQEVTSLCYPSGQFNDTTQVAAEAAGYDTAVTTVEGLSDWRQPFALSRLRIKPSLSIDGFAELIGSQSK